MRLLNLTPHPVTVCGVTVPPSGTVARVSSTQVEVGTVAVDDGHGGTVQVPLRRTVYGAVEGLPGPQDGVLYVVSAIVLARCADRPDVVGPDTGPTALRNDKGHIVGVVALVTG